MRRRPRTLSKADRAAWARVAETLRPLGPAERATDAPPKAPIPRAHPPVPHPVKRAQPAPPKTSYNHAPDPMQALRGGPVAMDAKAFGRMKRGKLAPEARIDLHGMSAERAHAALLSFMQRAHADGRRLVLVITGKGRGENPARRGVLRTALPHWLAQPPLARIVLQIAPAHERHGGAGAYYVYLRRPT